jgi:hypothetical protein
VHGAVLVGGVGRGVSVDLYQREVGFLGTGQAPVEVLQEGVVGAFVLVPQNPCPLGKFGLVADLEEGVAGVGGEGAEQVRAQHRGHHRAVAAAGLAADGTVVAVGDGAIVGVHERHDLLAQVRVVAPGAGGVEKLAAAVCGPRVDVDHDRGRRLAPGEHVVGQFGEGAAEGVTVEPHRDVTRVALDHIDGGVAPLRLGGVSGRKIDPQRTFVRVTESVAAQQLAVDGVLLETARELGTPGKHA